MCQLAGGIDADTQLTIVGIHSAWTIADDRILRWRTSTRACEHATKASFTLEIFFEILSKHSHV